MSMIKSIQRLLARCARRGIVLQTGRKWQCVHTPGTAHIPTLAASLHQETGSLSVNSFAQRSHTCGELRAEHEGEKVRLCGWLEFRRMGRFLTLRDAYGSTQLVLQDQSMLQEEVPYESVVAVTGVVGRRPRGQENPRMATGQIEVSVKELTVLNAAEEKLPFSVRKFNQAKESLRMRHRYLALRFPEMQRNLRMRSSLLLAMRTFLCTQCGFVDVETPTLFRRTPGGAQEFVVPTRIAGHFYSLVQSPQQFKQLLMAGGLDRYCQVARCYRDEGARPDRQPEFTQLDLEMSFADRDGVLALVEQLLRQCWPGDCGSLSVPFPRMSHREALDRYGTDKPDTRFPVQLQDLTEEMRLSADSMLGTASDATVQALVLPGSLARWPAVLGGEQEQTARAQFPRTRLLTASVVPGGDWEHGLRQVFTAESVDGLARRLRPGDVLHLAVGPRDDALQLLGRMRLAQAEAAEARGASVRAEGFHFLWVLDFPLFHEEPSGEMASLHHPFTRPHPEDASLLPHRPLQVRGLHYDLVLNGCEVGGGSERIHDAVLQRQVLGLLGIDPGCLQHLLDGLASGCPPHAGIALGLDRLVALMCGADSIRDVMAFPKGVSGRDAMSGAPVPLSRSELELYHLRPATPS
ncbi:aspartate--tRNA ligase, mitochondrial [Bacillus rossius redtenbacheri]|uniref:aspartate--tRNA ligase, mitochondrial n=1 Tax=Bacillus rossius redtenbacheri TaxID=93214 RepID=UPI002FDE4C5B